MRISSIAFASLVLATAACQKSDARTTTDQPDSAHVAHDTASAGAQAAVPNDTTLPPPASGAVERLNASPRHGEYVMIPSNGDSIRAWVVYPSRKTKAPVVVVIHEIFGLSSWVRATADQIAAAGYIAIAPDFLANQNLPGAPDNVSMQDGISAVAKLNKEKVQTHIDAVARYGMALPSAERKYGIVGFCWGGEVAFKHVTHTPNVSAAVVFYGPSPKPDELRSASVKAPVLGVYGQNDARVVTTIPPADSAMRAAGKTFTHHIYEGATHGFLRDQAGASGANLKATQQAWPATIAWFRKYLGA